MTYDADNRLLTYNGQNVEYDAEGNMTKGPLNGDMAEFSYDCRNRLVKVKEADGTVTTYEYDAENVRTAKVTGGVRTEYTTDRESTYSQVLVKKEYEKNVFGLYTEQKIQTVYTYGTGLVSERRDGGEKFYYHYNHLGSTMAVSDKGGNVVYRFVYDTYGELSDIQNGNRIGLQTVEEAQEYTLAELADAAGIEYLYNGKYGVTTDGNGLYYMRARYYNQDIKRFINRDVLSGDITNSQSLNRYCYVQGNPVSLTDPFGLCPTEEEIRKIEVRRAVHTTLDVIGIFFDGADILNGILYALEGDNVNAALCLVFFIPGVGSAVGLTVKYVFKIGGNAGEALAKFVKKYAPELAENGGRLVRNVGGKLDDAGKWINRKVGEAFGKDSDNLKNILNVGAGDNPIPCAINIDINPSTQGVIFGDANNLRQFTTGQFDHVIALNPYNYNVLDSDISRVLKDGGIISITGNYSNKYFKKIYNASQEELSQAGVELISKGDAGSIFLKYGGKVQDGTRAIRGKPLQIILRKVSGQR